MTIGIICAMEKEIKNIVFYTFESETGERTQACVFYTDGTVKTANALFE